VYPLSAVVHLLGAPASVTDRPSPSRRARTAGAASSRIRSSWRRCRSRRSVSHRPNEIQGELGTIEIDEITRPREIALSLRDGTAHRRARRRAENNMVYEVAASRPVRGDDPTPDQERSLAVLRAVEAIHRKDA
jgi:hypothetical protein